MPKSKYKGRLTQQEVLDLFHQGRYYVDPDTGIVYSGKTRKPLYTFYGNKDKQTKRKWCRVFAYPRSRAMPVSHCVWLWKTRTPIPPGFEIHHRNEDGSDDRWKNLFALHELDHKKLHNGPGEPMDDLLRNTPF
jgi:hypothetical protein